MFLLVGSTFVPVTQAIGLGLLGFSGKMSLMVVVLDGKHSRLQTVQQAGIVSF